MLIEKLLQVDEPDEAAESLAILFQKVDTEVATWSNYESKLFELYMYSGLSYRDISHGTDKTPKMIKNPIRYSKVK